MVTVTKKKGQFLPKHPKAIDLVLSISGKWACVELAIPVS